MKRRNFLKGLISTAATAGVATVALPAAASKEIEVIKEIPIDTANLEGLNFFISKDYDVNKAKDLGSEILALDVRLEANKARREKSATKQRQLVKDGLLQR